MFLGITYFSAQNRASKYFENHLYYRYIIDENLEVKSVDL